MGLLSERKIRLAKISPHIAHSKLPKFVFVRQMKPKRQHIIVVMKFRWVEFGEFCICGELTEKTVIPKMVSITQMVLNGTKKLENSWMKPHR